MSFTNLPETSLPCQSESWRYLITYLWWKFSWSCGTQSIGILSEMSVALLDDDDDETAMPSGTGSAYLVFFPVGYNRLTVTMDRQVKAWYPILWVDIDKSCRLARNKVPAAYANMRRGIPEQQNIQPVRSPLQHQRTRLLIGSFMHRWYGIKTDISPGSVCSTTKNYAIIDHF